MTSKSKDAACYAREKRANNGRRLLFFSLEDWNEVWRRNQFVCAELIRRHRNLQILWVSPVVDVPYSISRRAFEEIDKIRVTPQPVAGTPQVLTIKPIKYLPNKIGKRFNDRMISSSVRSALRQLDWRDYDVWINAQQARNYLPLEGAQKLIYDITDDWTKIPQPAQQLQYVIEDDGAMLSSAEHVIVCSKQLYASKQGKCKALSLIPNGVDNERYHPQALSKLTPPKDMIDIPHPIVGYTGTLHSSRLDLALIEEAARLAPDLQFVFVGPNCLEADETARINLTNVHILGSRSYAELPKYLSCFDACMTPHLVNDFTESLDPLKLYEYMSTGKPIVSTPCAGFRESPELIHLVNNASELVSTIRTATKASDQSKANARLDWARGQSWARRVDEIDTVLGWN